tara:strand:+ start:153 stop:578 length:426 start_codon:yes stop_codon:yes gene_type:complete
MQTSKYRKRDDTPYTTDCPSNGCTVKTSEYFQAQIKYGRPIVASYIVDPATNMATSGDEDVVVVGSNFDPVGTPVDAAVCRDNGDTPYAATGCTVVGHTPQMNCNTAAGAGANHKLVVTIADQQHGAGRGVRGPPRDTRGM